MKCTFCISEGIQIRMNYLFCEELTGFFLKLGVGNLGHGTIQEPIPVITTVNMLQEILLIA